jgi:hypothetical protein
MKKNKFFSQKIHFMLVAIIVAMFFGMAAICSLCSAPAVQTTAEDTAHQNTANTTASAGSTAKDTDNGTSGTTAKQTADSTEETESAAETSAHETEAPNNPPKIMEFFITEGVISTNMINDAWVNVLDEDGDTISYDWTISAGSINNINEGRTKWQAPGTAGTITLTVIISDGKGGTDEASVHINVVDSAAEEAPLRIITINPDNTNSGYISYGTDADPDNVYKGANLLAGDDNLNNMCKGYASFAIPETLFSPAITITKVELIIRDILFSRNPESFASELNIKQHDFGNLELADFSDLNGTLIGKFPTAGLRSNPQIVISGDLMINTLMKVIEADRTSYQIKLGLNNDTNGDGSSDSMVFHGANVSLVVTYSPTLHLSP